MDTTDAPPTSRRIAQVGLIALGASTWLAGLVAVGLISSRTDPIIGESAQNLVVTYVLLLPAFLWLDVRHVGDVDTVAEYDLVIVGGAIQYDNWMSGAADFVRAHRRQLATTTVAFFFTCLALSKPGESATRSADRYEQRIRAIAPELDPLGVGRFAGVLDYSRMTPVSRIFVRIRSTLTRRSAAGPCGPEIFRGALPRDLRRCAMRSTVHHRPSVQHSM